MGEVKRTGGNATPAHRGRVQAQGGGTQRSVSWAQSAAPTEADGHRMLDELYKQLTTREQNEREDSFRLAHNFVDSAADNGGVDAPVSKSFPRRRTIRVDIEVHAGKAFVR